MVCFGCFMVWCGFVLFVVGFGVLMCWWCWFGVIRLYWCEMVVCCLWWFDWVGDLLWV